MGKTGSSGVAGDEKDKVCFGFTWAHVKARDASMKNMDGGDGGSEMDVREGGGGGSWREGGGWKEAEERRRETITGAGLRPVEDGAGQSCITSL